MWFNIKKESAMQIRRCENWGMLKGKFMKMSDNLSFRGKCDQHKMSIIFIKKKKKKKQKEKWIVTGVSS